MTPNVSGDLTFHPFAEAWPLLEGEDFQELVEDIKANGLLDPIVLYQDKILDGRNRYRACVAAGVEPRSENFDGDEDAARAFVASKETRRHLTRGQRALGRAVLYPNGGGRGRGKRDPAKNSSEIDDFSGTYLRMARTVLAVAPKDLAPQVRAGTLSLDAAYEQARRRKEEAEGEAARLSTLRNAHPELADKVVEGELTLPGAEAEARERDARERELTRATMTLIEDATRLLTNFLNDGHADAARRRMSDPAFREQLIANLRAHRTLPRDGDLADLASTLIPAAKVLQAVLRSGRGNGKDS